jgi:hypothetical protein
MTSAKDFYRPSAEQPDESGWTVDSTPATAPALAPTLPESIVGNATLAGMVFHSKAAESQKESCIGKWNHSCLRFIIEDFNHGRHRTHGNNAKAEKTILDNLTE